MSGFNNYFDQITWLAKDTARITFANLKNKHFRCRLAEFKYGVGR